MPCRPCKKSRSALHCSYEGVTLAISDHVRPHQELGHARADPNGLPHIRTVETPAQPPLNQGIQQPPNDATEGSGQRLPTLAQAVDDMNVDPVLKRTETQSMEELQKRITRLEQQLHSVTREKTIPGGAGLSVAAPRPHLRVESGKTRLFGQSHWMHTLEQVGSHFSDYFVNSGQKSLLTTPD